MQSRKLELLVDPTDLAYEEIEFLGLACLRRLSSTNRTDFGSTFLAPVTQQPKHPKTRGQSNPPDAQTLPAVGGTSEAARTQSPSRTSNFVISLSLYGARTPFARPQ